MIADGQFMTKPQRARSACFFLRRAAVAALTVTLVLLIAMSGADAATKKKRSAAAKPQPERYASIVIEAETGYVLSAKNADAARHPASLTKMMTLYLTFEAIQNGRLSKNTRVPVSKHAAFQAPSELGLAAGSTIRVEDAIYGLVTKSANDAAVVLAEAMGGSESRFADMMTRRAHQLGMKNTTFRNASGLHDPRQVSSARDMALLGQALLRDFPRDFRYFSTKQFTYAGRTYANHNKLLNTYAGADGIKTGFINASGFNLVASAKRNGTRLIGVVFGGQTSKSRNDHMEQLLDLGFDRINDVRVASALAQRQQQAAGTAAALSATSAAALKAAGNQQASVTAANGGRAGLPHFDAIGMVTEQGDQEDDAANARTAAGAAQSPSASTPLVAPSATANTLTVAEAQARAGNANTADTSSLIVSPAAQQLASAAQPMAKGTGQWAVQVGAFSSHDAGLTALRSAHQRLPQNITNRVEYVIVPLMTNRGVIYRARMTGLEHDEASNACNMLKDTCLVLTSN